MQSYMKFTTLLSIYLLCISYNIYAQNSLDIKWARVGGGDAVAVDKQGNIYSAGSFTDTFYIGNTPYVAKGDRDIIVQKFDKDGYHIWARQYSGPGDAEVIDIVTDNSGDIYLSGEHNGHLVFDKDTLHTKSIKNLFLTKIDAFGYVKWAQNITGIRSVYTFNNLASDDLGNIYMSASIEHTDSLYIGSNLFLGDYSPDIYIIKYNSNGDVIWVNRERGTYINRPFGIAVDKHGNVYNTGHFSDTTYFGSNQFINKGSVLYLSKYDSSGKLLFVKTPPQGGRGTGMDVAVTQNGDVYMCGQLSYDTINTVFGNDTLNPSQSASYIVKFNSNGDVLWSEHFPVNYALHVKTINNDVYLHLSDPDITLVKFNLAGNVIWTNKEVIKTKTPLTFSDMDLAVPYGIIVTGIDNNHNISAPLDHKRRAYTAHIGPFPLSVSNTNDYGTSDINLFPNPASQTITLKDESLTNYNNYSITDMSGRVIINDKLVQNKTHSITISQLPDGIYQLQLLGDDNLHTIPFIKSTK